MANTLFCNVGWMESYRGLVNARGKSTSDPITGGGSNVEKYGTGWEVCNFVPVHGKHYAYVRPPGQGETININKLGAKPADSKRSGVTVVWTAKRPRVGSVVIGWFTNATVYRHRQDFEGESPHHEANDVGGYWITADIKNSVLLKLDERVLKAPRGKGLMGQPNIWYPTAENKSVLAPILRHIKGGGNDLPPRRWPGKRKTPLPEHLKRVEQAAVNACALYYDGLGYEVDSKEKDNLGWDLEATLPNSNETLRIEVKGLSGTQRSIQLTPNEYSAFAKKSQSYRLVIISDALKKCSMTICYFSRQKNEWMSENESDGRLLIKKKTGAVISL